MTVKVCVCNLFTFLHSNIDLTHHIILCWRWIYTSRPTFQSICSQVSLRHPWITVTPSSWRWILLAPAWFICWASNVILLLQRLPTPCNITSTLGVFMVYPGNPITGPSSRWLIIILCCPLHRRCRPRASMTSVLRYTDIQISWPRRDSDSIYLYNSFSLVLSVASLLWLCRIATHRHLLYLCIKTSLIC